MSVLDSLLVALIVMSIVFIVLIVLSLLVKIQSIIFNFVDKKKVKPSTKSQLKAAVIVIQTMLKMILKCQQVN